jgi:excisionase family DNA binding protein
MIGTERAACLHPLVPDLRDYRPMDNGKREARNPWLRVSEWLRVSAWFPPCLALVWLATLASLVHDVGIALADWGATVSLAVLVMMLVQRRHVSPRNSSPDNTTAETVLTGTATAATGNSGAPTAPPTGADFANKTDAEHSSASSPTTSIDTAAPAPTIADLASEPKARLPAAATLIPSEIRVLTAEEVASVLRVDIGLVIASISKGELPGNRIGRHWRIDQVALMRWLRGPYGRRE